jgi:hypothetical protein
MECSGFRGKSRHARRLQIMEKMKRVSLKLTWSVLWLCEAMSVVLLAVGCR